MIGIDGLIGVIHKEIERSRSVKAEEKRKIREAFLSIKIVLNSAILKIKLCKEHGYHHPKKLRLCIPEIVLEINHVAGLTKDILDIDIYNGLVIMANWLVDFNEKINSLSLGTKTEPDIEEILKTLNNLKDNVEKIENE